jgi:hypothetical protein
MKEISRLRAFRISPSPAFTFLTPIADDRLLWRFRFWLMRQTSSWAGALLSLVLRSVDWSRPQHRKVIGWLLFAFRLVIAFHFISFSFFHLFGKTKNKPILLKFCLIANFFVLFFFTFRHRT